MRLMHVAAAEEPAQTNLRVYLRVELLVVCYYRGPH